MICLQETLLTKEDLENFSLVGFKIYPLPADSSDPKSGQNRGLITAVSNHLISKGAPFNQRIILGDNVETLTTEVVTDNGIIAIHNVYVHQNCDPKSLSLKVPSGKHIVAGDFNARHREWEPLSKQNVSNPRGNKLFSLIQENPKLVLCNTPRMPTTIFNTTLTLSLVSAELSAITDWDILSDCVGSPHIATCTTINISPPKVLPDFKSKFIFEKADWVNYRKLSDSAGNDTEYWDWEKYQSLSDKPEAIQKYLASSASLESVCSRIVDTVHSVADQSIPKTKKHDKVPAYECWWFNEDCKKAKSALHKAASDNRKNKPGARANLRRVRSEMLEIFELAKHKKWNDICQSLDLSSSLGAHWRRLRWLYNGGSPPQPVLIECAKAKAKADESMQLFSNRSHPCNLKQVTRLILDELHPQREQAIHEALKDVHGLSSEPFTITELEEALSVTKSSSPGEDNISYTLLSHLGLATKYQILHLYNMSHATERSPSQWKTFPIIPIPKKDLGEYRPIALLSCLAKVMERMILARLKFLIGPLHPNLMGCTQGRGTQDAIATLGSIASDAKHRRSGPSTNTLKSCFAIFIDFEKAFELANITTILDILCTDKGIKGHTLGWIQDYLMDRKGYTTVQGIKSDVLPLYQGTPQGSVLSPYLFNLVMDKLLNIVYQTIPVDSSNNITINSYADDIVLVSNHFNAKGLLDIALGKLELASMILGLQINIKKTKAMSWNHSDYLPNFQFTVYSLAIEWVRTFKYLGVTFDDNLSFCKHVDDISIRVNKIINVLKHLAGSPYGATQKTLLHYYKACIRPIIEYGSIILIIACPSAIKRLETLQNIALKIALRVPKHTRTKLVHSESGCTSIIDRVNSLALLAMAKIKAYPSSHPYFQSGKQMHTNIHMLGKKPAHPWDLPLDMVIRKLEESFKVPNIIPFQVSPRSPKHLKFNSCTFLINQLQKPKASLTEVEKNKVKVDILEFINSNFSSQVQIYVDGSKDPDSGRAGAGVTGGLYDYQIEGAYRLSDDISSTQAELAAIHLVLSALIANPPPVWNIVIHCDSMPALLTISQYKLDPLAVQAHLIWHDITILELKPSFHLTFHWLPSHVGIEGNERADFKAKQGLGLPEITHPTPPTIGQIRSKIRAVIRMKTQNWFSSHPSESAYSRYRIVNPSLSHPDMPVMDPIIQQWVNRLRVDSDVSCYQHDTLNTCVYCNFPFSAGHYLLECPISASPDFCEPLTEQEFSLPNQLKAPIILAKITKIGSFHFLKKGLIKHPPKIKCPHPEHGLLSSFQMNLPMGL